MTPVQAWAEVLAGGEGVLTRLAMALPMGGVVDADVLGRDETILPYLALDPAGNAELALVATAARAATAVLLARGAATVRIVGAGLLARAVAMLLGPGSAAGSTAVIDCTGSQSVFDQALIELAPRDRLVLAAWPPHPTIVADLYQQVHRSGVVLCGPPAEPTEAAPTEVVAALRPLLTAFRLGSPTSPEAPGYLISP